MGPTEALIKDFAANDHPLGHRITVSEVAHLVEALRRRLGDVDGRLDYSLSGLQSLENLLVQYHRAASEAMGRGPFLVQLVREVAAFFGETLVQQCNGRWDDSSKTLWGTRIIVNGPWHIRKETQRISPFPTVFLGCATAAWAWDQVLERKRPKLANELLQAKLRRLSENLLGRPGK